VTWSVTQAVFKSGGTLLMCAPLTDCLTDMFETHIKFYQKTIDPISDYLSVRLTMSHVDATNVCPHIAKGDFIMFYHKGAPIDGAPPNEHVHLFIPGAKIDVVRKRIKDKTGLKGNGGYSCKEHHDCILKAIQYGTHEPGLPKYSDSMAPYYWLAPNWVVTIKAAPFEPTKDGSKLDKCQDYRIDYHNVVWLGVREAKAYGGTDWSLAKAINHFRDRVDSVFSYQLSIHGLPDYYKEEFLARLGKRKRDTNWADFKY